MLSSLVEEAGDVFFACVLHETGETWQKVELQSMHPR